MDNFLCAGFAAVGAITIMNPVDVIKTRLQFQGELEARGKSKRVYTGVVQALMHIARSEGRAGLYKGYMAAVFLQYAVTSTRFGVYFVLQDLLGLGAGGRGLASNFGLSLFAAACGGAVGTPFFALKTRMQAVASDLHGPPPTSAWQALRLVYVEEGLRGYWHGMSAFVPRVMAYGSVQLSTYDTTKHAIVSRGWADGVVAHLSASLIAAGFAVGAMQPFDFVAARLMNQPYKDGVGQLYSGPVDCMLKVVKSEGPVALFKGCGANYARMGPYTVLVFTFFEQLKAFAKKARGKSKE